MSTKTSKTKTAAQKPAVQTVIQINVYRYKNGKPNFLLLKRIDEDNDHFWQPISQEIDKDEVMADALEKAIDEQVGITGLKYLSNELYKYEWYSDGRRGRDIVFAGEVSADTLIFPDLDRYDTFAWMPYKEALLKLKWDGNKQSLRQLMDHLEAREQGLPDEQETPAPSATPTAPPDAKSEDKVAGQKAGAKNDDEHDAPHDDNPAHQSTKDLSDELIPNYGNDDENDSGTNSVFPL